MKVGIDSGGSLIKTSVWKNNESKPCVLQLFKSSEVEAAISLLKARCDSAKIDFFLTGGGARCLAARLHMDFGEASRVFIVDEMHALNDGLGFCLSTVSYPTLVVNIGSGVSILQVEGPKAFTRVGGSSLGGGTFMGLSRLLTEVTDFKQLVSMAKAGSAIRNGVDLTVGDIYSGGYDAVGLQAGVIASSFGAVPRAILSSDLRPEVIIFSLLRMISFNVAQIAALFGQRLGINNIYVLGGFVDSNGKTLVPLLC